MRIFKQIRKENKWNKVSLVYLLMGRLRNCSFRIFNQPKIFTSKILSKYVAKTTTKVSIFHSNLRKCSNNKQNQYFVQQTTIQYH